MITLYNVANTIVTIITDYDLIGQNRKFIHNTHNNYYCTMIVPMHAANCTINHYCFKNHNYYGLAKPDLGLRFASMILTLHLKQ